MAVRGRIKTIIDANIQEYVGAKDSQKIAFPYPLNADEKAYLNAQIVLARESVTSDDDRNANLRTEHEDTSATHPVPVTDTGGGVALAAIQALLTQIETNTDQLEVITGDIDINTDGLEALVALTNGLVTAANAILTTIDADTGAMVVDLAAIEVLITASNVLLTSIDADTGAIKTSVELIDDAVGDEDTNTASKMLITGSKAVSGVPTEVDDGDDASLWINTLKQLIIYGANLAEGTIDISWQILPPFTHVFTQLTAAGDTAAINVEDYNNHTFQILIASIDDSVDLRAEGSLDGTNWFNLSDSGGPTDVTQYTEDGVYQMHIDNFQCKYVRFAFDAEVGGTAVTVDVTYMGGRN